MSKFKTIFWSTVLFMIIAGFSWLIWWAAGGFSFWGKMAFEVAGWLAVGFGCAMSDGVAIPVRIISDERN